MNGECAVGAVVVSPALQRGEDYRPATLKSRRDGAKTFHLREPITPAS